MKVKENCNGTKTVIYEAGDDRPSYEDRDKAVRGMAVPIVIQTDRIVPKGSVLWVDDMGHVTGKAPINTYATEVYHSNCRAGTGHFIVGDCFLEPPEWHKEEESA